MKPATLPFQNSKHRFLIVVCPGNDDLAIRLSEHVPKKIFPILLQVLRYNSASPRRVPAGAGLPHYRGAQALQQATVASGAQGAGDRISLSLLLAFRTDTQGFAEALKDPPIAFGVYHDLTQLGTLGAADDDRE